MGLDINFYKRNRVAFNEVEQKNAAIREQLADIDKKWQNAENEEEQKSLETAYKELCSKIVDVDVAVAYFRKVNFLLPFFGYEDNCSMLKREKCQVEDLVCICNAVLKKAEKDPDNWQEFADDELSTEGGFFFGSTDYDEWYIQGVKYVAETFTEILDSFDWENDDLIMYCWW